MELHQRKNYAAEHICRSSWKKNLTITFNNKLEHNSLNPIHFNKNKSKFSLLDDSART